MQLKFFIPFIFLVHFVRTAEAQVLPPFYSVEASGYADSIIKRLTPEERIGQLFMVAAWSNKDSIHIKEIQQEVRDYGIGGLIFFQGGPVRQAMLTNDYQKLAKVPLLIGIDGEWGLAMRLDSTIRFPRQMTLSAAHNDSLVYEMGKEIARECKRLGIHTNFSPVADVNNNILNPIIGSRSFGDDRETVTRHALTYMRALQDNHILACGKHFPGHGNTDADSHLALPLVRSDSAELDSVELFPFRELIRQGLGSMMVAHLYVPALDTIYDHPSTLSKQIVTGLLKEKLNFNGIIFTDALNMKGVSACYMPGLLEKLALFAGNDVLLYSEDVRKGIEEIHYAEQNCEITQDEIDARVKKVLMMKYWCGLNHNQTIDTANLYNDLNSSSAVALQQKMYETSITRLSNKDSILPLRWQDSLRIASVAIGESKSNAFQKQLQMYAPVECYTLDREAATSAFNAIKEYLKNYDVVILSLHNTVMNASKNFGISEQAEKFINEVTEKYKTVFVDFGNAYTLSRFSNLGKAKAVVLAYEDMPVTQSYAAQFLFGGAMDSEGKIPIQSTTAFNKHSGTVTSAPAIRFKYSTPEDAGINSEKLAAIDSIVNSAIADKAMPGCQVLVARDGKVVYYKSFGTHTYSDSASVTNSDLYDIASVSKIAGTALAVMKLYEQGKIDLDKPVSKYLPRLKKTNKSTITIKEVMAHQSGLQALFSLYKQTVHDGVIDTNIYHAEKSKKYSVQVAESLYMKKEFLDTIDNWIDNTPLGTKGKYVYSDLGPILMKELVEQLAGKSLDSYLYSNFYKPLGLTHITYNPRTKFPPAEIIPTENDTSFRKQLIHGFVHDPAAAMLGGVSGNAGIFSDANDLAVIMQMLLNGGTYGGRRFLKEKTVSTFTYQAFPLDKNRRGLFFDKPEPDITKPSPTCKSASLKTFGHQGFTGTCTWVDPEYNLVYVFLSNRVNPDAANEKLVKLSVRTQIQQVIYDALE
jgi:beta-N-acetylhexosaminidase